MLCQGAGRGSAEGAVMGCWGSRSLLLLSPISWHPTPQSLLILGTHYLINCCEKDLHCLWAHMSLWVSVHRALPLAPLPPASPPTTSCPQLFTTHHFPHSGSALHQCLCNGRTLAAREAPGPVGHVTSDLKCSSQGHAHPSPSMSHQGTVLLKALGIFKHISKLLLSSARGKLPSKF